MTYSRIFTRGLLVVSTLALAAAVPALRPAEAVPSYDGVWSVVIVTQQGICDPSYRYPIRITKGNLVNAGHAQVTISGGWQERRRNRERRRRRQDRDRHGRPAARSAGAPGAAAMALLGHWQSSAAAAGLRAVRARDQTARRTKLLLTSGKPEVRARFWPGAALPGRLQHRLACRPPGPIRPHFHRNSGRTDLCQRAHLWGAGGSGAVAHLNRAGFDLVGLWGNLLSAKALQLRTAGPWWATGSRLPRERATAAVLSRAPALAPRSPAAMAGGRWHRGFARRCRSH
jgi:hypothetical protein